MNEVCASSAATELEVQRVQVYVGAEGQPVCVPHELPVTGSDVNIRFVLMSSGWQFPATEAVVVTDGGNQFPDPAVTEGPRRATLLDVNDEPGVFAYKVTVQNVSTGELRSVDPAIRNES
ncbi:MAG: hypothetical protein WAQ05_18320 [Rubrivivax sp.]